VESSIEGHTGDGMSDAEDTDTDLGSLRAEYVRARGRNTVTLVLMGVAGLIGVLAAAMIEAATATVCVGAAGLAFIGLTAYGTFVALRDRGLAVRVYSDGLVETRGGRRTIVRWGDVDGVVHSVTRRSARRVESRERQLLTLTLKDGTRLEYSEAILKGLREMAETVQHEIMVRELPRVVSALKRGQTVTYGKIQVGHRGITSARIFYAWDSLMDAREENGRLSIMCDGTWHSLGLGAVPNAFVLVELVRRAAAKRQQEP
jgi:hypothetical protein